MKPHEYFYVPPQQIKDSLVEIKGSELKHLTQVLRKKSHDVVTVIDGTGNIYTIVLTDITKTSAIGEIQKKTRYLGEPNFHLTLAQAIPKGNRFDMVIEKGTEIGVSKFIPLITEHSIAEGSDAKISRWKKIAIAAIKQCARSVLPEITLPSTFDAVLFKEKIHDFTVMAHPEQSTKSLTELIINKKDKLKNISKIKSGIILVGPEGGFTPDEVKKAQSHNFELFSLGQRRLRTETAGIVASAIMMELVDNYS